MFKYKSPLSRLLEGAGKTEEKDAAESVAPTEETAEPIADFNALRQALAGGNATSETYEESDELMPEEKMPDFAEEAAVETPEDVAEEPVDQPLQEDHQTDTQNVESSPEAPAEDDPVVTLRLGTEDSVGVVDETPEAPTAEAEEPAPAAPIEDTAPAEEVAESAPTPAAAPATDRRARVKTTFLGFERADTHVQDMMESAEPVSKTETAQETFPVGWLVVTAGPGRGASITLTEGLMQIGRNDDQAIQLDFGDTGISRENHAVIAYDPEDRKCYLGHGGKANLVRLNGKPVLSTIALTNGDLIRISETSIRFMSFCDDGFDWRDS